MSNIIKQGSEFDHYDLTFELSTAFYKGEYFLIQTPVCKIIEQDESGLWITCPEWLHKILSTIEHNYVKSQAVNLQDYLKLIRNFNTNIFQHINGIDQHIIYIRNRNYTRYYGNIVKGQSVKVLLSINFNNTNLIWNINQIKTLSDDLNQNDFLQECQLEQQLIKI